MGPLDLQREPNEREIEGSSLSQKKPPGISGLQGVFKPLGNPPPQNLSEPSQTWENGVSELDLRPIPKVSGSVENELKHE